jgi:HIV Tat-specific factor 1
LPQDVDTEEVRDVFQKYGIIAESAENDEKRIKLYNDEHGNFKGEALIGKSAFAAEETMLT